jgi:phosphoglycerol transferase MdoB-like AlkP superfamily enzyme
MLSAAGWQVFAGLIACGLGGFVSSVRRYYAHCTALDDCLGSLCATLDETGLTEDTLLVFFSDHGDMLGSQGQIRKQRPFDEAVRSVPSFAMPFLHLLKTMVIILPRQARDKHRESSTQKREMHVSPPDGRSGCLA